MAAVLAPAAGEKGLDPKMQWQPDFVNPEELLPFASQGTIRLEDTMRSREVEMPMDPIGDTRPSMPCKDMSTQRSGMKNGKTREEESLKIKVGELLCYAGAVGRPLSRGSHTEGSTQHIQLQCPGKLPSCSQQIARVEAALVFLTQRGFQHARILPPRLPGKGCTPGQDRTGNLQRVRLTS